MKKEKEPCGLFSQKAIHSHHRATLETLNTLESLEPLEPWNP